MLNFFRGTLGYIAIIGYYIYESVLFGAPVWISWNITMPYIFDNVNHITFLQSVAIIMLYKSITFTVKKLGINEEVA